MGCNSNNLFLSRILPLIVMSKEENGVYYFKLISMLVGIILFYLIYLIFFSWDKNETNYYANNPDAVPGAFIFIAIFVLVPFITFAGYLSISGFGGLVEYYWNMRGNGEEEVTLH